MTSLQWIGNELAARSTDEQENSDKSDCGDVDEDNDSQNRVTIHDRYGSFYNETDLATSFLSHQETSSSSVIATG